MLNPNILYAVMAGVIVGLVAWVVAVWVSSDKPARR
jgi:hypothetical protein